LNLPRILAIVGPTASGKTSISLLLAELLNGEILSADSRQIYKRLDIGTAKPSLADRRRVKHHFIDLLEPDEEYSAGQFGKDARVVVHAILKRGMVPILVGGSGLYVKAVIDGLFEGPGKDPEIRERLTEQWQREGIGLLLDALKKVDPAALAKMKEVTPRRVIRALEVFHITGKPLSQFHAEQEKAPGFETIQVGLDWERRELYARINQRVDRMIADGLIDEVRALKKMGLDKRVNALNTIGYKEVFDYLAGMLNYDEMVFLIKQNTRRFAKRQLTWFKADERIHWIAMAPDSEHAEIARDIEKIFRSRRSKP
jgi:tRNA dimethylallyltransferase